MPKLKDSTRLKRIVKEAIDRIELAIGISLQLSSKLRKETEMKIVISRLNKPLNDFEAFTSMLSKEATKQGL